MLTVRSKTSIWTAWCRIGSSMSKHSDCERVAGLTIYRFKMRLKEYYDMSLHYFQPMPYEEGVVWEG